MPVSLPRHPRAALLPPIVVMAILLSSCLAPSRAPRPPSAPVPEEAPWESMSAFIALGDPAAALAAYEQALSRQPTGWETKVLHARLLLIAGKLPEAREELALLLAERPSDAEALSQLALLEGLEGNRAARKALLEKVVAIQPGRAEALAGLGDLALEDKDAEAAEGFYAAALAAEPSNLVALLGTAEVRARRKDWEGAAEAAGRAVEADPTYPFARIDRARARRALGDTAGAIEDLTAAIALDPSYPWSYIDRGRLYIGEARDAEALADFDMAVTLGPEIFAAWAYRAGLLAAAGREAEAASAWERVVSLRPDYWYAWPALGELAFARGDWARARETFLEASRYGEELSSLFLAALAAHRAGDPRAAAALVEPALPAIPRDSWEWDVARLLTRPGADLAVAARADREPNRALRARMLFYLAEMWLAAGREAAAMKLFVDIDGAGDPRAVETRLARRELARYSARKESQ